MFDARDLTAALGGRWHGSYGTAKCVAHDDSTPSLSIGEQDGTVLVKCHAGCEQSAVIDVLKDRGLWPRAAERDHDVPRHAPTRPNARDYVRDVGGGALDQITPTNGAAALEWIAIHLDEQPAPVPRRIASTYDYRDEDGELVFQVARYHPKGFRQRRPDGKGGWDWSVKGVRQVPYRLDVILERPEGSPVFVVEGEKDVDRLVSLGLVATCNAGGAGKWRAELSGYLFGATVYILPDHDDAGHQHAQQVAASLLATAESVRVVELPGLPPKGDVSDWLDAGGDAVRLLELCEAAPLWPAVAEEAAEGGGLDEWDAGDDDADIPPRGWLLGNTFCRRFQSSLIAAGGTGKTALRTAQALSMATGRSLTEEHVFRRCRVLLVSLEDDRDELRRRVRAAMNHLDVSRADVRGWLFLTAITNKSWKLATAENGVVRRGELVGRLEKTIVQRKIDVLIMDPFVKTHAVPENDNGAIDQVAAILTQLAIDYDLAVDVPHHMNKLAAAAGDANSARGASSFTAAGRLNYTLLPMTPDEAQTFGVSEEERRRLVRMDSAKVNIVPASTSAHWFRLASVDLGNANDDYPAGDNIQVAEPWTPPDFWRDLSPSMCCRIVDEIDGGMDDGERFSGSPAAKARGAWQVVLKQAPTLTEKQARKVVATWLKNGVLEEREYDSEARREPCKGLFANPSKRPGPCPNG